MLKIYVARAVFAALASLPMANTRSGEMTYDRLAYMTFSVPVQVPGVTLSAGTYRFHLVNDTTNRHVIQVLSEDGSYAYAMFHTMPDRRQVLTFEPTVTFKETPAGVPPVIRSLFYGAEYRGYEFVYGKDKANAKAIVQPPVTYVPLPAPPLEPDMEPIVPELETTLEPPPALVPVQAAAELPRTATPLPLLALGGLGTLLTGLALGFRRRRAG
jgi:LPXTG-motif cell wall-anchored protein